eukprot:COSAG04_NODE_12380_length_655_cov_1.651079_1_plen_37_part_10
MCGATSAAVGGKRVSISVSLCRESEPSRAEIDQQQWV